MLRRAVSVFAEEEIAIEEGLRWGWLGHDGAVALWDLENYQSTIMSGSSSPPARRACSSSSCYLNALGISATWCGEFAAAASRIAEVDAIAEATGTRLPPLRGPNLAGLRGQEADASALIEVEMRNARAAGQGIGDPVCQWVSAVLYNGLGRYEEALAEAQHASEQAPECWSRAWALSRADRGGLEDRGDPARRRDARAAGRGDERRRQRLGVGYPRALAGAAQ